MRRVATLAAALALAAGCARESAPPEEVVFWQLAPVGAIQPLVRRFEAENPGLRVRVEQLDRQGAADAVAAAVAAGAPPDLCELEGRRMPAFLASGDLVDWSAGVADQRDSLRGWEPCLVGDAIYGMPWRVSARVLLWNRRLFARAGLDSTRAPETWDQLHAAASRIQRLGGGVHGYGLPAGDSAAIVPEFLSYAWGNGGEVLSAGGDSARFDSARNVEALEFLLRVRRVSLLARGDSLDAEFEAGRLGLRVADSRLAARLAQRAPALRIGVSAVPARSAGGGSVPFGEASVLASFTRSRHKEHALRLARFLVRPALAVERVAAAPDAMPANAGADTLAWFRGHPHEALLAAQASRARFAPAHPEWAAMERALADEIGQALDGAKPARRAVADADERLAELAGRR